MLPFSTLPLTLPSGSPACSSTVCRGASSHGPSTLKLTESRGASHAAAEISLTDVSTADGSIDAAKLREAGAALDHAVLWIEPHYSPVSGAAMPPIVGMSDTEMLSVNALVHDECRGTLLGREQ